ncbi:MAG: acetyl-CoA carboxylase biotin carboxyl carrier protein subunit [Acidimicrobiales bacterium]
MPEVRSEIDATVQRVAVTTGAEVTEGDELVVLLTAEVAIPVLAPVAGRLTDVPVAPGDTVAAGDVVAVID